MSVTCQSTFVSDGRDTKLTHKCPVSLTSLLVCPTHAHVINIIIITVLTHTHTHTRRTPVYTYIHIYMYTHTHTHIHIRTYVRLLYVYWKETNVSFVLYRVAFCTVCPYICTQTVTTTHRMADVVFTFSLSVSSFTFRVPFPFSFRSLAAAAPPSSVLLCSCFFNQCPLLELCIMLNPSSSSSSLVAIRVGR